MRKELRDVHAKLEGLVNTHRAAIEMIPRLRADAEAAISKRDELMTSARLDPYSDTDALSLTILTNRAGLLKVKADHVESTLPSLAQAAREYAPHAHGYLVELLEADARALQAKTAAKLAKAGDLEEDEATDAALSVRAVAEAWSRVHAAKATSREDAAAVLTAIMEAE